MNEFHDELDNATRRELPAHIGRYRILEQIGEGGAGDVFLGEQTSPIRRRVAIKRLKRGMNSREILARFNAERQVLAMMAHPNIARMLDAGSAADGTPFFVMEYIAGSSIVDYCNMRRLPLHERLELFRSVCAAVQHAHEKGVIHRDLKPSNILVSDVEGEPQPKIIDFGIARAMSVLPGGASLAFAGLHAIGTPAYMSPEHADLGAAAADTRSDVYSLGVILYELVCGSLPLELDSTTHSLSELQRRIREVVPTVASHRIIERNDNAHSVALHVKSPQQIAGLVKNDLDWVVQKALEKEPARRYQTVLEFAADVQRYLARQPVIAARPGRLYIARKFVARHALATFTALSLAALLIVFTTFSAWQALVLAKERDRANIETRHANEIAEFMVGLFSLGDPQLGYGSELSLREAVDIGARRLADATEREHYIVDLQRTIANIYVELGNYAAAEKIHRDLLGLSPVSEGDQAEIYKALARTVYMDGRYEEALVISREAVNRLAGTHGERHVRTLNAKNELAVGLTSLGQNDEAEAIFQELLEILEVEGNPDPTLMSTVKYGLGSLYERKGELQKARPYLQAAYVELRAALGEKAQATGWARRGLAKLEISEARYAHAESLLRVSLAVSEDILGNEHPQLVASYNNLAATLRGQGKLDEAVWAFGRAASIASASFGEYSREVFVPTLNLAGVQSDAGKLAEAEATYQRLVEISQQTFGGSSPELAATYAYFGSLRQQRGEPADAERLVNVSLGMFRGLLPENHWRIADAKVRLARAVAAQGRNDEARSHLDDAIAVLSGTFGDTHPRTIEAKDVLQALANNHSSPAPP